MDVVPILAALAVAAGTSSSGLDEEVLVDARETGPKQVQLDGDAEPESVDARRHSEFRYTPRISDSCFGRKRLGPMNDAVVIERVALKDVPGSTLLFVVGSSGATGRMSDTRVWRLGSNTDARGCPKLNLLFAFPDRERFPMPKPPKGTAPGSFGAQIRERQGEFEIATTEGLYRRTDGGCCPSYIRTGTWRFDHATDRFKRKSAKLERVPRP